MIERARKIRKLIEWTGGRHSLADPASRFGEPCSRPATICRIAPANVSGINRNQCVQNGPGRIGSGGPFPSEQPTLWPKYSELRNVAERSDLGDRCLYEAANTEPSRGKRASCTSEILCQGGTAKNKEKQSSDGEVSQAGCLNVHDTWLPKALRFRLSPEHHTSEPLQPAADATRRCTRDSGLRQAVW